MVRSPLAAHARTPEIHRRNHQPLAVALDYRTVSRPTDTKDLPHRLCHRHHGIHRVFGRYQLRHLLDLCRLLLPIH